MKKLLGLFAIAPMAVTACGGGETTGTGIVPATYTVEGTAVVGNTGIMDGILNKSIDFAGTWGDARFNATDDTNVYTDVVAVGVEQYRVANDGVQARPGMDAGDIYSIQELFIDIAADPSIVAEIGDEDADGNAEEEHVLELYGHENYDAIRDTNKKVTYLKNGVPTQKSFIETTPTDEVGKLFDANGKLKAGQSLDIEFIPSTTPAHAIEASEVLEKWLNDNRTADDTAEYTISVASDYDAAATKLENGTVDLAFLPVNTWAEGASNAEFILQAGRSAQVATLDYDGLRVYQPDTMTNQRLTTTVMNRMSQLYIKDITSQALTDAEASADGLDGNQIEFEKALNDTTDELYAWANAVQNAADAQELNLIAGSYESYIWAHKDGALTKELQDYYAGNGDSSSFVIDIDGMDLKYGYTSTTSSSTYVFPELWLYRHLDATIKLS